jgi:hypothetical protein
MSSSLDLRWNELQSKIIGKRPNKCIEEQKGDEWRMHVHKHTHPASATVVVGWANVGE